MGDHVSFFASLNGSRVVALDLMVPYYGAPVADVLLADAPTLTGAATLTIANLSLAMTVIATPSGGAASGAFAGSSTARLVGGAGGWSRRVSLAPYRNPAGVRLSTVLGDAAKAAQGPDGRAERVTLASGLDRSLGAFYVPETRAQAGMILSALAGSLWWIDIDGVTQVARARASTTITTPATVDYVAGKGHATVATEDLAAWQPGATYTGPTVPQGFTISRTRIHTASDGVLRVEVLTT